jgi:hypothetical protein
LLTALVAVALSLWKIYLAPYYRQQWAIDELKRLGVSFGTEPGEGPGWVGWLVGEEYFVRVAIISQPRSTPRWSRQEVERLLPVFDRLPFVRCVSCAGEFTDADLAHLRHAEGLTSVSFTYSRIQGHGLRHLARAKGLQALSLSGSASLGDAALEWLESFPELEVLSLSRTAVTDEGLALLSSVPRLRTLSLHETAVGDAGLANLPVFHELESLRLNRTRITDAGLKHLEGLPKLRWLKIAHTATTTKGLLNLLENSRPLFVDFTRSGLTVAEAEQLVELPPPIIVKFDPRQLVDEETAAMPARGEREQRGEEPAPKHAAPTPGGSARRRETTTLPEPGETTGF